MPVIAKRYYCSGYDNSCGYSLPYGAIAGIVLGVLFLIFAAASMRRRRLQRRLMRQQRQQRTTPTPFPMQTQSYMPPTTPMPVYTSNPAPIYDPTRTTAGSAGIYSPPTEPPQSEFSSPPPYEQGQFPKTKDEPIPNLVT